MAPVQEIQKSKSFEIVLASVGRGPGGEPLLINSIDNPKNIVGNVVFKSNYDCKGSEIILQFTAIAKAKWSTRHNNKTVNVKGEYVFDQQRFQMDLPSSTTNKKSGTVAAGEHLCPINIAINASTMPSSFRDRHSWMTYRLKATLVRSFPSLNLVREQVIWVLNSVLPPPRPPLADFPVSLTKFQGVVPRTQIHYLCVIPSTTLYLGQQVPVTIKILPSAYKVQVIGAVVKMKQYTELKVQWETKSSKKEVLTVPVIDGWPGQAAVPEMKYDNSWQRTVVVPFPVMPQVTPTIKTKMITKTHTLKLIMQVNVLGRQGGKGSKHELRVEMPVTITGPRPPGEQFPSFDLDHYLPCVDQI
ncbi:hypothetical protein EDD11_003526 [Mortierella claussenii]|nr:hypothetical protein EDD11_003526 [Mortierella claussenii]